MKIVLANTIDSLERRTTGSSDCREMIRRCGANTGNVCFVDAVCKQLAFEDEVGCLGIEPNEKDAIFVLPASNWINKNGKVLQRILPRLEKSDVQLLALGIGVQMKLDEKVPEFVKELSQETIRALKILSEHSVSIGVRGEITAEVLDKLSIHNWQIIGCPSFYEPYRKYQTIKLSKMSLDRVIYNTTPGLTYVHKLLQLAMDSKQSICLQSMEDMPLTLAERKTIEKELLEARYPGTNRETCDVENYLQKFGHIFYDQKTWSEYLSVNNFSFSVGTRFHGNMMAFINGVPALWIVHDARTKELAEAMKLPFIYHDRLEDIDKVEQLLELCEYDSGFVNHYKEMGKNYVDFLNRNGVCHSFEIG